MTTIPGLIITAFCILFLKGKAHRNGFSYIVEVGGNWGGLELGAVAICGNYSETNKEGFDHIRSHEFGHSIQQLIFGPLFVFIIGIPSAVRYWYFELTPNKPHQDYDYVWFEYTASKWGTSWINKIENKNIPYNYVRKRK